MDIVNALGLASGFALFSCCLLGPLVDDHAAGKLKRVVDAAFTASLAVYPPCLLALAVGKLAG